MDPLQRRAARMQDSMCVRVCGARMCVCDECVRAGVWCACEGVIVWAYICG